MVVVDGKLYVTRIPANDAFSDLPSVACPTNVRHAIWNPELLPVLTTTYPTPRIQTVLFLVVQGKELSRCRLLLMASSASQHSHARLAFLSLLFGSFAALGHIFI